MTQKTAAILAGGMILFAFMLTMPDVVAVPGIEPFQPDPNRQRWANGVLEMAHKLPGAALSYLMVLTLISLPIGLCSRLARRRAAFKRLSAPAPHGKYLLWGRNLRRHANIPARYSGLRPRKTLRPLRQRAEAHPP